MNEAFGHTTHLVIVRKELLGSMTHHSVLYGATKGTRKLVMYEAGKIK